MNRFKWIRNIFKLLYSFIYLNLLIAYFKSNTRIWWETNYIIGKHTYKKYILGKLVYAYLCVYVYKQNGKLNNHKYLYLVPLFVRKYFFNMKINFCFTLKMNVKIYICKIIECRMDIEN